MRKGFTLIEIVIVVAIILIIASILVSAFSRFSRSVELSKDAERVASFLNRARSNTISSRNDQQYGVHFELERVVLFSGGLYIAGATTNEIIRLQSSVTVTSIALSGGGVDVIFDRLTGVTSEPGTITLALVGSPSIMKQITVSSNGVVAIQ